MKNKNRIKHAHFRPTCFFQGVGPTSNSVKYIVLCVPQNQAFGFYCHVCVILFFLNLGQSLSFHARLSFGMCRSAHLHFEITAWSAFPVGSERSQKVLYFNVRKLDFEPRWLQKKVTIMRPIKLRFGANKLSLDKRRGVYVETSISEIIIRLYHPITVQIAARFPPARRLVIVYHVGILTR